ncbi:MAG: AraC family transcriptional regulator [Eubacteriales bacterium]|nr:AraC family transcriptional regulator [Eubacteriales bacterium]
MDWLGQLNDALRYIEENLDEQIDLNQVAKLACCSSFHFQRMFSYMANVPLSEYIRRRRMTQAAFDLQNSRVKVLDLSLRYGYDSPTAFNRAFQSVHGVSPSEARKHGVTLKAYPPIRFKITIRGEAEMNYRIETKESFRIVGVKLRANWSPEKQEGFGEVPKFWAKHAQLGTIPQLCQIMDPKTPGIFGVSTGDWQHAGQFDYYIAVASGQPVPEGMTAYEVPACTWAIFECRGAMPAAIQSLQQRIVTEWLPGSGYQYANAPDIELYSEGDQSSPDYTCWVWLPVQQ